MHAYIRITLLAVMLALAGCMPAKKAPTPGDSYQASASSGGAADASSESSAESDFDDEPMEDLALEDEGVFSPEQEKARAVDPLSSKEQKILDTDISFHIGLDTDENEDVQRYFHYYTHTHRGTMEGWLKRAQRYLPHIRERFLAEGLPEDLIYLPFAESGFNPFALSRSGASGVWQFMPRTGIHYGLTVDEWIDERRDPHASTEAAIKYLKKIYAEFGDWSLALAAYNAGEGRIGRALAKTGCEDYFSLCAASNDLHKETKLYVPKFLALVKISRNLEGLGFEPLDFSRRPPTPVKLKVKPGTDLLALSKTLGVDWQSFRELNPALRKKEAPPKRSIHVAVPGHLAAKAKEFLRNPVMARKAPKYAAAHKVKAGDTWWGVARKYNVSVKALQAANKKTAAGKLQIGQSLHVPGLAKASVQTKKAAAGKLAAKKASYVVLKGDTLWSISREFKTDQASLRKANGLSSKAALKVGQKIYVPDAGSARTQQAKAPVQTKKDAGKWAAKRANYVVRKGDTLWSISREFKTDQASLRKANGLSSKAALKVGQKIYVPDAGSARTQQAKAAATKTRQKIARYKVQQGDTLWGIARQFGVSADNLREWNKLAKNSAIRPGDELKVLR